MFMKDTLFGLDSKLYSTDRERYKVQIDKVIFKKCLKAKN